MIFNIVEFRAYVENQIVWLGTYKSSIKKEDLLNAVCQF